MWARMIPHIYLILPLLPAVLGGVLGSLPCDPERQYQHSDGYCCSKCPPGHYMFRRCSLLQETECRLCSRGIAYNPSWNTKYQCEPCRQCVGVFKYLMQCSLNADAMCACQEGLVCATQDCLQCVTLHPQELGTTKPPMAPTKTLPKTGKPRAKSCDLQKRKRQRKVRPQCQYPFPTTDAPKRNATQL